MPLADNPGYRSGMVDLQSGRISREIFVNDAIYRQELERLFARAWLFVGHESQIPNPGDFVVSGMGEESVILCRDRGGEVHVFLNSCCHRGMKVCRYDEGNTAVFTCPYHGWSYDADGRLVGVPFFREAYHSELDRSQWGLVEVAQLRRYKGTVWASWDSAAPSFFDYLGDFRRYLDLTLDSWDGSEGGSEVLGGVQKWLIPCNWKFPAENFSGDSYHNISHRSVDLVGIGPSGSGRRDMRERQMARRLQICFPERGHQTEIYVLPKGEGTPPAYRHSAIVSDYFAHCEAERRRRCGEWARVMGSPGEVFPNTALHPRQPRTIAVWHPRGAYQPRCGAGISSMRRRPPRSNPSCAIITSAIRVRPGSPSRTTWKTGITPMRRAAARWRAGIPTATSRAWGMRSPITNGTGSASPAGSWTSPRRNQASTICAICTAAGRSSWKRRAGTS